MLMLSLLVAVGGLAATLLTDTSPQLGLDLQGGISVVLAPKSKASTEALSKAVEIIRSRVDSLGVAEPEISRQGGNIVVNLPGIKNPDKARDILGRTAELRFRPVLRALPAFGQETDAVTTTTVTGVTGPTGSTAAAPGVTTTTATGAGATAPVGGQLVPGAEIPTTKPDDDLPEKPVVLVTREGADGFRYELGPAELTGKAVRSAKAMFQGEWKVQVKLNGEGAKQFDALAAKYFGQQVALVLDGVVQSAPSINAREFKGTAVISGQFRESEAKDLALVLRYGALPVQLEELTVQAVSPSLGRDQLRAGLLSGAFGLALVALYMLLYYRLLGLVVWAGIALSGALIYSLTSYLGETSGLSLTLAGVTGLIVSVGVTVDSYVVYFERLKDEVRSGRTIRSSLDRGFTRSFRTILAADFVSLIGAGLLYLLAVGSVRGFAFFLGMSTLLDIAVAYCFMHPLVSLIGRRPSLVQGRRMGIAAGLGTAETKTAEPRTP